MGVGVDTVILQTNREGEPLFRRAPRTEGARGPAAHFDPTCLK